MPIYNGKRWVLIQSIIFKIKANSRRKPSSLDPVVKIFSSIYSRQCIHELVLNWSHTGKSNPKIHFLRRLVRPPKIESSSTKQLDYQHFGLFSISLLCIRLELCSAAFREPSFHPVLPSQLVRFITIGPDSMLNVWYTFR